jgi:heat shock protein HslJ
MSSALGRKVHPWSAAAADALLMLVCVLAGAACSTLPVSRTAEPPVIVVRNRSGIDIATVTLCEAGGSSERAGRFGSLSPVSTGVSQSYVRPKAPPSFPANVAVEWVDSEGRTRSRDVNVSKALRSATGAAGEVQVFEIGPYDDILVFLENAERTADASADPGKALEGGPWLLFELNSAILQLPAGERQPYLLFKRQDSRVTGYAGCNDFFGSYDLKGDALTFGRLGMTRRFCAGAAGELEQAFLSVLPKARRWRMEGQMLLLMEGDQVLARLRQERGSAQQ